MRPPNPTVRFAFYGLLMGFVLSRIGFGDYAEVFAMFTFHDLRMFLTFAGGVGLIMLCFLIVLRIKVEHRPLNPGTALGGALFGIGWALCGACPSIALVQIGEGQMAALVTMLGILVGTMVYPYMHRRWFRWETGSCNM